jgi:hypothetical protein
LNSEKLAASEQRTTLAFVPALGALITVTVTVDASFAQGAWPSTV